MPVELTTCQGLATDKESESVPPGGLPHTLTPPLGLGVSSQS